MRLHVFCKNCKDADLFHISKIFENVELCLKHPDEHKDEEGFFLWYDCEGSGDAGIHISYLGKRNYGYDFYIYNKDNLEIHYLHPEKSCLLSTLPLDLKLIKKRERDIFKLSKNPILPPEVSDERTYNLYLLETKEDMININYYDQNNFSYLPGWNYVYKKLKKYHHHRGIILDIAVDATFFMCKEKLGDLLPYKQPWIGIVHHVPDNKVSPVQLMQEEKFLKSLHSCLYLIVFSQEMKEWFDEKEVKTVLAQHPISFKCSKWTGSWEKVIQVGRWHKNVKAIHELKISAKKAILGGKGSDDVEEIERCNDQEYDELLANNIIFVQVIKGAAMNIILECIIRSTPIIINRIRITEETLGKDYPLFYDDLDEVEELLEKIEDAHEYLEKMDKEHLRFSNFLSFII